MATSYLPLVGMLPPGQLLEYVIVENNAVCRGGGELMANDRRLHFRTDLPPPGERYDILHCGSSLHYIDDWQEMLVRFAALEPAFMLFADLPAADNRSFVTQQMFHDRRIPVHFWNLGEFIPSVQKLGYELILKAKFIGHYVNATAAPPTGHFNPSHRLSYCSQLIFRRPGTS